MACNQEFWNFNACYAASAQVIFKESASKIVLSNALAPGDCGIAARGELFRFVNRLGCGCLLLVKTARNTLKKGYLVLGVFGP